MFKSVKNFAKLYKLQRGITGLETAIILIAFVVVASVFAYTVLSAGIFSSEKGKEAIHSGIQQARSSMEIVGSVVGKDTDADGDLDQILVNVTNALRGEAVDLTTTTDADADGLISDEGTKSHLVIITYRDKTQQFDDITWTTSQLGKGDSDALLEENEKFQLTVNLGALSTVLTTNTQFAIEIKPQTGSSLVIQRTTPGKIDSIVDMK